MGEGIVLERSNLIDVTCAQIHSHFSSFGDGTTVKQLEECIQPRISQLSAISSPFGQPSDASKKKIDSGSVTLADGVVVAIDKADKEYIFAISKSFNIDEIHALVLFRSFLYNHGLPAGVGSDPTASFVDELVEAIIPFYHAERVAVLRILIPLLRARADDSGPFQTLSQSLLPKIIPDGKKFANTLIDEYLKRTKQSLDQDYKAAARSAKQNAKEQLVLLEVLFWLMWGLVPCDGQIVQRIIGVAYETNLGSQQEDATLFLGEESQQLQQDIAVLWVLICIEILELEAIAQPDLLQDNLTKTVLYTADPSVLKHLHDLIVSNNSSHFACIYLAWTFVVFRIATVSKTLPQISQSFRPFLEAILPSSNAYSEQEPVHVAMSRTCLDPRFGLIQLLLNILTSSPWFVTSVAWRSGSHVTDPNAIAFRSVMKGLIMSLVELLPVESIDDFDSFVEVWVALFGRSESQSVVGICKQFWDTDFNGGIARRAIFEVARSRFPLQPRPLLRLLRAMTASGFLNTDPFYNSDCSPQFRTTYPDQLVCTLRAFEFFNDLSSYTQAISPADCIGANARYQRQQSRYKSTAALPNISYTATKDVKLPGGVVLRAGSIGQLLSSDPGDSIVVCWEIRHSGWKLIHEMLHSYLLQRQAVTPPSHRSSGAILPLNDIGLGDGQIDDTLVTDIFDLIRSVMHNSPMATLILQIFEQVSEAGSDVPDLVQLTAMILEDALHRMQSVHPSPLTQLIISAMSVLGSTLAIPAIWTYIRSTAALFGSEGVKGSLSIALAMERATGNYTITRSVLQLVQDLAEDADLVTGTGDPELHALKAEVLVRALSFVHTEIWVEHLGWKYAQLGDRFDIGRRVTDLYLEVLRRTPGSFDAAPNRKSSQHVLSLLLFNATTSSLGPLITSITTSSSLLDALYSSRRLDDSRALILLIESHQHLTSLLLTFKKSGPMATRLSLIEQMLCARPASIAKASAIDVLASHIRDRNVGTNVPLLAMNVISTLCSSLSLADPLFTLVGHLSDPESMIASLVRIVDHPYEELPLRYAVWRFFALAMENEAALAILLTSGHFQTAKEQKQQAKSSDGNSTAIQVAESSLGNWQVLWDSDPQLLVSVLRFLNAVWKHHSQHSPAISSLQQHSEFWESLIGLVSAELGPLPEYETSDDPMSGKANKGSPLHEVVAMHCYRTIAKSLALNIMGLDIGGFLTMEKSQSKIRSLQMIVPKFKSEEDITELLSEAAPNSYRPEIYDTAQDLLSRCFPKLSMSYLQVLEPLDDREFGAGFAFSTLMIQGLEAKELEETLSTLNLNTSLMHSQLALTNSWQFLLQQLIPVLRGDKAVRPILMNVAASLSFNISKETRGGDMAATIHRTRLAFLVAILELIWFSPNTSSSEISAFIELVDHVRALVLNEYQPPAFSLSTVITVPFHSPLLQLLYFCTRFARSLSGEPSILSADQRLKISLMVEDALTLIIGALGVIFTSARGCLDSQLDDDMSHLVAVFEQCTSPEVSPSTSFWLARCEEINVIKASLDLFSQADLVGLSNLQILMQRKRPFYVPHLITFFSTLAGLPAAAERLACDGLVAAYTTNSISGAISLGRIDISLPELPGMRSPAHTVYCSMLAVLSSVMTSLGPQSHYLYFEVCAVIQHFRDQIIRVLSWSTDDAISSPFLEEIEQVVRLFYAMATSSPTPQAALPVEDVLSIFSSRALNILQQLNFVLTHPDHLSALFQPVDSEEHGLEEESGAGDPLTRPLSTYLLHRLYRLSYAIIFTLIKISRADLVLTREKDVWHLRQALIIPHSKIVLSEPASLGTLMEMANTTMDLLKGLLEMSSDKILPTPSFYGILKADEAKCTVARHLEAILVYSVTQLAMWLVKESEQSPVDMDTDIQDDPIAPPERRPRASFSLHDRLRRGLTGELAVDIQSLLQKARPIIGKLENNSELVQILATFMRERILHAVD